MHALAEYKIFIFILGVLYYHNVTEAEDLKPSRCNSGV